MKKLIIIFIAFFSLFYWTKPVGDVNLNGKVTITDLVILHRYLEGLDELNAWQRDRADMNRDGKVDEKDLILLRNKLAGLE
jgi:hypothetical protein